MAHVHGQHAADVARVRVHEDAAGARQRRSMRRQQRGADHAGRAARHVDVAEAALVGQVAAARQQRGGGGFAGERGDGRFVHQRRDVEVVEPDLAGGFAADAGEQARLGRQQGQRVRGAHQRARRGAGVGEQAGGHVDAQDGRRHFVQDLDGRGERALRRARLADTQQGVDAQVQPRTLACVGQVVTQADAGVARLRQCPGRVRRQRTAGMPHQADAHVDAGTVQPGGQHQAVAAVVARPGRDPGPARAGRDRARETQQRHARARHQRVRRQGGGRAPFDAPRCRVVEQRHVGVALEQAAGHGHRGPSGGISAGVAGRGRRPRPVRARRQSACTAAPRPPGSAPSHDARVRR